MTISPLPTVIPHAEIPSSNKTVEVSIIDSSTRINGYSTSLLFTDPIPGFDVIDGMPSWAFLISHPSGIKLLFDGGTRVDWETDAPPAARQELEDDGCTINVQNGINQILQEGGIVINQISGMIWSHMHWDHVGDLTLFPAEMPLVVGPGFKAEFLPGWPEDEDSTLDSRAWSNRRPLIELSKLDSTQTTETTSQPHKGLPPNPTLRNYIDNAATLTIGELPAIDVFSDGSFYLLSTPGHTPAHLCALARTGSDPSEFILLAADAFDNGGQIRPSPHIPLPERLVHALSRTSKGQNILSRTQRSSFSAAGSAYTHPFLLPEAQNIPDAENSLRGMMRIDARTDVLTLCAHEKYHLFVAEDDANGDRSSIPFFPALLNGWSCLKSDGHTSDRKNLREQLFWWFLRDYGVSLPISLIGSENESSNLVVVIRHE